MASTRRIFLGISLSWVIDVGRLHMDDEFKAEGISFNQGAHDYGFERSISSCCSVIFPFFIYDCEMNEDSRFSWMLLEYHANLWQKKASKFGKTAG
jgi:hypothetical protein